MPVRRRADPISVQHVWDAIRAANAQRQMADMPRIIRYLQRVENCSQAQAELHMKQTLDDGLILAVHKVTAKGSKAGSQVESYKIPVQELPAPENDGRDWYCIDCHLAGDVTPCRICHRVFHVECAHKNKIKHIEQPKTGSMCDLSFPLDKKRMSYLSSTSNSPLLRDTTQDNESSCSSNGQGEPKKEKTEILEQDTSTTTSTNTSTECIVDNVERELEKLEESCITNSSSCSDPQNSESVADITKSKLLEIDKESGISSSKSDNIAVLLGEDGDNYDETLCIICNMYRTEPDVPVEKEELNYLLTFVHSRIRSWLPASLTDTMSQEPKAEWLTEAEVTWRGQQLFYQPVNMGIMEMKLQTQEYTKVCQFKADVLTVQHNVAIYHGIESQEYGAAEYMLKDCHYDISELLNCPDCYKHSNEKINDKWFCLPCRIPHKLVWAKQKGYPYWPAKVIKETDDACDVRFFGGKYERSVLPKMYIKPIAVSMNTLQVKKSAAFNKSLEELMFHQKLLDDPGETQQYIALSQKRRSSKINRTSLNSKSPKPAKVVKKRSKSTDLPKDVFEFDDSTAHANISAAMSVNISATASTSTDSSISGTQPRAVFKRKRSTSPSMKVKPIRTMEYPTRRAVQNQINRSKAVNMKNGTKQNCSDLVNMSTDFEDRDEFAIRDEDYEFGRGYDGSHEEVSSSTEHVRSGDEGYARDNSDGLMPQPDRQYSESVEKTRRKLEQCREKKQLIKIALECMQAEIDRINNEHDDYLKRVFEAHNNQISETKKKQWCYNCEQDAIYHCCWNTAYCSPTCQQQHWQAEHKKVCRRKR